ncbi:MAG TPA: PAS domain S-box protein, partial [bacterium]|nr:PAS domain S-box protein [bacterium]
RLIVEIKGNEDGVRKSEEKYRLIAENMTDVVWRSDLEGKLTFISSSIERLTGETVEENMKKSFENRFAPESLARIMPMFAQEFEKEKDPSVPKNRVKIIEAEQYKLDGSTTWVEISVSFLRDKNEIPIGFQGITREITDRKKAEAEIIILNRVALKLAKVSEYEELFKIIVETIKELTKVKSVVIGMYDNQKKVSKVKYYEIDSFILKELMTLFGGKKITEIEFPISDETFEIIRNSPVSMLPTLNEAAFGSISKITGKVIQTVQGIDRYVGLAYFIDDELFGTTLIGLEKASVDPSKEILYSFSQLISLTLKRLKVTDELVKSEEKYRLIAESSRIIAETQLKILKSGNIEDVFKILAESIHSIIGEGVVATVKLNDSDKSMQFVSCAGLGDMISKVIDLLGFDPTKKHATLDKMSEKELGKYSTGRLVKLENGLYDLLENLVPEKVSMLVQKLLGVENVFTIGLVEKDNPTGGVVILAKKDITDHYDDIEKITGQAALAVQKKKAEEELKRIEWMLSQKPSVSSSNSKITDLEDQGYGDITSLNRDGLISSSITKEMLRDIASEYLNLLETSSAIYEKNGDYAYGIFCSGWCRMMDSASRELCGNPDNETALVSGKWLCHESCWTDCSKKAIESQTPVDIECNGGIRLYAVPIFSEGEVIGAINFGYGDPPKDVEKLRALASAYKLDPEKLIHEANLFDSRPAYIIELAKQRLLSSARLIGIMVERKRAEAELLDRERRLQQIFDVLPIGLWFADEKGQLVMGNPAGVRIWGAEPKVGLEKYGVFKARRLPENVEIKGEEWALTKTIKEGIVIENELLEIDAFDGKKKVILNYTAPIMDDENKVTGAIVINQEVTEKYKYEEELRKSEEKFRLIAENMGNVITMLDMDLNYIYGTPNVEQVLGFSAEEYIKMQIDKTMTPASLQIIMHAFEEEMAFEMSGNADPKRTRVLELEEYCKDGSTIWMENVISFVRDEAGNPIGILAVSRDVTERRMALEEKARLTEQLYHAQKMESVGTLAGGIAHDFNNLLQVIGGYTSMLLSVEGRNLSEFDRLKIIEKSVDRASELVSNLLTFSRKNVSMKKNVDLNSEITASVKMLERTIPKMVKIKTEFDPSILKISADPVQIEQIILNLGKNASDAMPDGGNILIKTENIQNEKGKYISMTFSDTGSGMDKETKEHVFDPFFTTKEVGKGTGLGLASVYGIVESHGGHIHCESELGKGTVFTIYFPAVVTDNDNGKVITEKTKKLEGSETVLIVDDEENIRDLHSTALKEFGYKVITAQNGEEALIIFKENHHMIDLTILDLGMPGMGGFKCMLEMKKIVPDSKIIIASGYSEVFQTEDLMKSGASGFIQKPFKLKSVLEKIREVLDENTQPEQN